jgi:5'(3')-deoxyribonucleotidase
MKYLKKFEKIESEKKIIYIDMDDTICDYKSQYEKMHKLNPTVKYPQSIKGFFIEMDPIEGAIEGVNTLRKDFDVYILTRPSYKNPLCYSEKRIWIEDHFDLDFCDKLIISPNKALSIGDYLIDDFIWEGFNGIQLQYGVPPYENWDKILAYFKNKK